MSENIGNLYDELAKVITACVGDLDKIWQKHKEEVTKVNGALVPLLKGQLDAMMMSILLSRSAVEAEQLTADVRGRGFNAPGVVQATLQFIDARLSATDKSRAALTDLQKAFDQAQQAIKDHAATARADLSKSNPPGGGGGSDGGGSSGTKPGGNAGTKPADTRDAGPKPADSKDGVAKSATNADTPPAKKGGFFGR
jgi:hypothetical protein